MDPQQKQLNKITDAIEKAITDFSASIPGLQNDIISEIALQLKELELTKTGGIKNNVANLKIIGKIRADLEKIILNPDYLDKVKGFAESFGQVAKLQHDYFNSISDKFSVTKLLSEIQKQAIEWTIDSLTGLGRTIATDVQDLLRTNITSGGTYQQLYEQMRTAIISNKAGNGLLERYTKQIVTDSLNQYSRQYMAAISDDLGFTWKIYYGSNIETTRDFCKALTKKRFVHQSELPEILKGHIDDVKVRINPKTDLWYGAVEGTNESNFATYSGGYSCQHHFAPVSSAVVPDNLVEKFK